MKAVRSYWFLLLIPLMILITGRLLPFILFGPHPLGYDTGFYNYAVNQERLVQAPAWRLETLGQQLVFRALISSGFNNEMILYFFPILITALTGLLIFFTVKSYFNSRAAYISALIYSLSFVQFLVYWEMLWKNIMGLCLALAVFYLLNKPGRRYLFAALIAAVLLMLVHKTTFFITALTLLIYYIFASSAKKYFVLPGAALLGLLSLLIYHGSLKILYSQAVLPGAFDFFSLRTGLFIGIGEFLKLSWFYLPLAAAAAYFLIRRRQVNLPLIFALVSLSLVAVKFIFYERLIVYLDLALVMLAGFGGEEVYARLARWLGEAKIKLFAVTYAIAAAVLFFYLAANQKPLISRAELSAVNSAAKILPSAMVFAYDSAYLPWLYGFSGHKIFAPGWGDQGWTLNNWQDFWNSGHEEKITALRKISRPLLIYRSDDLLDGDGGLRLINDYFYVLR